jgi:hypothetical protein
MTSCAKRFAVVDVKLKLRVLVPRQLMMRDRRRPVSPVTLAAFAKVLGSFQDAFAPVLILLGVVELFIRHHAAAISL